MEKVRRSLRKYRTATSASSDRVRVSMSRWMTLMAASKASEENLKEILEWS